jgi:TetR/AcrR family transcriptional repressor of mexCD-oprJ operon
MSHFLEAKLTPETAVSSTPRPSLRQRVAAAILDAAAEVLAVQGEQASMSDVAAAAGVARATLYRYFPSREVLLDELARVGVREAADRLAGASLTKVSAGEALERAVRALVAVGDYFVLLQRTRGRAGPGEYERTVGAPLREILEQGQSSGEFRGDVQAGWLAEALVGLVVSVLVATPEVGVEDRVAAITGLFLDGVRIDSAPDG